MTKPKAAVSTTNTTVQEPDSEGASAALQLLAQKPKRIPPEALVQKDYDTLLTVLKHGYTYTDIAAVYGRHGIKVTPAQLKLQVEARRHQMEPAEALATSQHQVTDGRLTAAANRTKVVVKAVPLTDAAAAEAADILALREG